MLCRNQLLPTGLICSILPCTGGFDRHLPPMSLLLDQALVLCSFASSSLQGMEVEGRFEEGLTMQQQ